MSTSTAAWRIGRFLNRRVLNSLNVQLIRPSILHGPPSYAGVVGWSRQLLAYEQVVPKLADVPGDFVECGVFYGYGLLALLHVVRSQPRERRIYGFDSFAGHSPESHADTSTREAEVLKDFWRVEPDDVWRTLQLGTTLTDEQLRAQVTLVPGWLADTLPSFSKPIAFLHLDVDYYEPTRDALRILWPQVADGGIVMFGLLDNPTLPGKGVAVREFMSSRRPEEFSLKQTAHNGHYYFTKRT